MIQCFFCMVATKIGATNERCDVTNVGVIGALDRITAYKGIPK